MVIQSRTIFWRCKSAVSLLSFLSLRFCSFHSLLQDVQAGNGRRNPSEPGLQKRSRRCKPLHPPRQYRQSLLLQSCLAKANTFLPVQKCNTTKMPCSISICRLIVCPFPTLHRSSSAHSARWLSMSLSSQCKQWDRTCGLIHYLVVFRQEASID